MPTTRPVGRPKRSGTYVRLNLDMRDDVKRRIEELRDEMHARSLAEVLQRALAVYDYVYRHEQEGAQVVVKYSDGEEERLKLLP